MTLWACALVLGCAPQNASGPSGGAGQEEPAAAAAVAEPEAPPRSATSAATPGSGDQPEGTDEGEKVAAEPTTLPDGTAIAACDDPPPGMACIPGGPFIRGTDDGPKNAQPAAKVWLQTFYIDVNEVTFAEYKACQRAKRCPRSGPRYSDFDHPKMPIQGVSWHDAVAYCQAQGKRLPTEAQWEKAARGPDGELYPWGDEPVTCERAIIKDDRGRSCGLKKAISKPDTGRPWDVGSRPAGRYGLHDMIGNSWEWVHDWYARDYEHCGEACEGVDPKGPCEGADKCPGYNRKIVRGGSWYWDETRATGVYRRAHVPDNEPFHHFGFRCAATLEDPAVAARQGQAEESDPGSNQGA